MAEEQDQKSTGQPTPDLDESDRSLQTTWRRIVLVVLVIAGLVVGLLLSQALAPRPKIGIVRLYDIIDYGTAPYYFGPLYIAAQRNDVKGVVILVDSPGGYATISEDLFYTISRLRQEKPVIASIEGLGASGSYYASAAANYIYARPAALVGSIGVIAQFPEAVAPDEQILVTGPFKGSGNSTMDFMRGVQTIKEAFLTNVYDQRLYALQHMHPEDRSSVLPPRENIATGQVWVGSEAYDIGLVDALGSNEDAIEKAARMAGIYNPVAEFFGIKTYDVIDLYMLFIEQPEQYAGYSAGDDGRAAWYESGPWVELYHLYMMPQDERRP